MTTKKRMRTMNEGPVEGNSNSAAQPSGAAPASAARYGLGASTIRSIALAVFGKAMTSRRLVAPARIMTIRSRPSAMPPCGGVPYSRASRKKPKRSLASASRHP